MSSKKSKNSLLIESETPIKITETRSNSKAVTKAKPKSKTKSVKVAKPKPVEVSNLANDEVANKNFVNPAEQQLLDHLHRIETYAPECLDKSAQKDVIEVCKSVRSKLKPQSESKEYKKAVRTLDNCNTSSKGINLDNLPWWIYLIILFAVIAALIFGSYKFALHESSILTTNKNVQFTIPETTTPEIKVVPSDVIDAAIKNAESSKVDTILHESEPIDEEYSFDESSEALFDCSNVTDGDADFCWSRFDSYEAFEDFYQKLIAEHGPKVYVNYIKNGNETIQIKSIEKLRSITFELPIFIRLSKVACDVYAGNYLMYPQGSFQLEIFDMNINK